MRLTSASWIGAVRSSTPGTRPAEGSVWDPRPGHRQGFTLLELVIVVAIVGILSSVVLPLARWSIKRQKEYELQEDLRILRSAIDRYHDMAVAGLIETDASTGGWPPDLESLVEGVELQGQVPPAMPAVSDSYTATGPGLVGGFAASDGSDGAGGMGAALGSGELGPGNRGAVDIRGRDAQGPGRISMGPDGNSLRVEGNVSLEVGEGGRLTIGNLSLGDSAFGHMGGDSGAGGALISDRGGAGRPSGPDGQPVRIVFLRRIPVDPMTGDADWGLRCYGEDPGDDLWCGRNVFDVHSRSRARSIDGRPYREW